MVQALLEVMPPTATNVDDSPSTYMGHVANAADAEMVSILMEDTDSLPFILDDEDLCSFMEEAADCDLAVDEDGELVYRDELRGFVGL
jgi:hypothetical protein